VPHARSPVGWAEDGPLPCRIRYIAAELSSASHSPPRGDPNRAHRRGVGQQHPLPTAPRPATLAIAVLRSYLPALVFVLLGAGLGALFAFANLKLGPTGPRARVRREPYECGLPSEPPRGRFTVSFYLVGLMFLIFDIEVILLYPTSVVLRGLGLHALLAIVVFVGLLGVAFVYEWRRGALEWSPGRSEDEPANPG
jgi:NADH-quinone oxidoreductase subunit A